MRKQRILFLIAFYVLVAMWTIRANIFAAETGVDAIIAVCIAISATLACIVDSKIVARPMSHAGQWVMLLVWPVAVPIYLLSSRGWRGFKWIAIHFIAISAVIVGLTWFLAGVLEISPR
jgi:hypothetical protein